MNQTFAMLLNKDLLFALGFVQIFRKGILRIDKFHNLLLPHSMNETQVSENIHSFCGIEASCCRDDIVLAYFYRAFEDTISN